MGMRADHQRHAAVEIMGKRLLLARRLGVEIDDDGIGLLAERTGGELALDRRERIVELDP